MNPRPSPLSAGRLIEGVLTLLGFALLTLFVSRVIWDIDVFWHIAAGRAFREAGALATTDIFTPIDPERIWTTFQWGYEVLCSVLDDAGGLHAVRLAHTIIMVAAFAAFHFGLRIRLRWGPWAAAAATLLLLVLFGDRIRVRPHIVNLLAWAILFPWMVRGPAALGRWAIATVAIVVGIWANTHAGGAFLFLVAALPLPLGATLGRVFGIGTPTRVVLQSWAWYAAALIPALLSPHFIRGNIQALTMLEATEGAIAEWLPTWEYLRIGTTPAHLIDGAFPFLPALGLLFVIIAVGLTVRGGFGALGARLKTVPLWRLGLVLALVVLSHRSVRFAWVAAFAWVAVLPAFQALGWDFFAPRRARLRQSVSALAIGLLALVAWDFNIRAQFGDLPTAFANATGDAPIDVARFPVAHADFLSETGFEGGIYSQGNWGGYLLYRLFPQAKVTADGRGNYALGVTEDLAYTYERSHFVAGADAEPIRAIYNRYPVDAVVHQHPIWPVGYTPPSNEWMRVFSNRQGAIWIRNTPRGQAYLRKLQARAESLRTQTPAP